MPGSGEGFQGALDGYAKFLRHRDSASALGAGEIARAGGVQGAEKNGGPVEGGHDLAFVAAGASQKSCAPGWAFEGRMS